MKKNVRENLSKRIIGTSLIAGAGIMIGVLFTKSLNTVIQDAETAKDLIKYCLTAGGVLWGVSIFDGVRFGGKKK